MPTPSVTEGGGPKTRPQLPARGANRRLARGSNNERRATAWLKRGCDVTRRVQLIPELTAPPSRSLAPKAEPVAPSRVTINPMAGRAGNRFGQNRAGEDAPVASD